MIVRNTRTILTMAAIFILGASSAWGAGFTVWAPMAPQLPGRTFNVAIEINAGTNLLKSYRIRLKYNPNVIRPVMPAKGANFEFTNPITSDFFFASEIGLFDTNNYTQGCVASGVFNIANLQFMLMEGAPSNANSPIKVVVEEVKSCQNTDITYQFTTNVDGAMIIAMPAPTTIGITQYLDLNGDGYFNYNDTLVMNNLVTGAVSNTSDMALNVGGLQGDLDGNGFVDLYDVGYMNAMTRNYQWCSTGPDGIAQNPVAGDDVEVIPMTFGKPNAPEITAGPNSILNTTPAGDDQVVDVGGGGSWNWISTGPNGIAQTTKSGDDVQVILAGQGYPYAEMIRPGPNGVIDSVCEATGDDALHSFIKDITKLLTDHPAPGRPYRLVKVSPTQYPFYLRQYLDPLSQEYIFPPVALMVRIEDENGNPKVGLAPTFIVTEGSGTFDGPAGPTTTLNGMIGDQFLGMGQFPKGTSVVVFHPVLGDNSVSVILSGDAVKGIDIPPTPVDFSIIAQTYLQTTEFPDFVTVQAQTHNIEAGGAVPILITLKRGTAPVHGLQDRIVLMSNRNFRGGVNPMPLEMEQTTTIFSDQFEDTIFPVSPYGTWQVPQGGSRITRNGTRPGMFGSYGLRIMGAGTTVIQHQINAGVYSNLKLGYQWSFTGDAGDGSYIQVDYSTDGGANWKQAHYGAGLNGLYCPGGICVSQMILETRNLAGDSSAARVSNFLLRFSFSSSGTSNTFWLDNVGLRGVFLVYEEDFESTGQVIGSPPSGFDPVDRITSGPDGLVQTSAGTGDVQRIPVNQGEPNQTCILPGLDKTLDSVADTNDYLDAANNLISTGADGICQTHASGDDFQVIPVGQGLPYSIAITPGNDGRVTTTPNVSDEAQLLMGPGPAVVVDNAIGGATGGNQGHNNSQKFAKIGRNSVGSIVSPYALRKIVNVAGMENVWLQAWTHTLGLANVSGSEPGQKWVCEVSDNGGASFVPVWDSSDTQENTWTLHKVCLSCNHRIHMVDGLIIQWRANMNKPETGSDPDAAYVDDIQIFGTPKPTDVFGPIIDTFDGSGNYTTTLTSLTPGTTWLTAIVRPYNNSQIPPFAVPGDSVNFNLRRVDPNSVLLLPANFTIKACDTLEFMVVGHYSDRPGTVVDDITQLYNFVVNGPASITPGGRLAADCFVPGQRLSISVNALPQVAGLYDPGGGGEGQQTGYIDGKVFRSTFPYPIIQSARVRILGTASFSSSSASDGSYFKSGVPVYNNYTVQAIKDTFVMDQDTGISVVAGSTTTDNLFMPTGSDTDGDTTIDTNDSDDDNDGLTDANETVKSTTWTDPDTDGDGYSDSTDTFPTSTSEWEDTDLDGTGDNADTDDDDDDILDSEEIIPGADGYVTDPKLTDTDGDTLGDYAEINTHSTDPSKADTDSDGLNDNLELTLGSNPNVADSDGDTITDFHEYWNPTTNIISTDETCYEFPVSFGLFCWADWDGDGTITVTDLNTLRNYIFAQPVTYGVYPANGETGDLDGDGAITVTDSNIMVNHIFGQDTPSLYVPGSITLLVPVGSPTVPVGGTQEITVRVKNNKTPATPMAGVGVLFTISGNGVLLGGRGSAAGLADPDDGNFPSGSRWDITGPLDAGNGGTASMTVKVTGAGAITVGISIHSNAGKHFDAPINLTPSVTINP